MARAEGPHTVRSHAQEGPWLRGMVRSNVQEGSQGLGVIHTVRSHVQKRGPGVGWSNASWVMVTHTSPNRVIDRND